MKKFSILINMIIAVFVLFIFIESYIPVLAVNSTSSLIYNHKSVKGKNTSITTCKIGRSTYSKGQDTAIKITKVVKINKTALKKNLAPELKLKMTYNQYFSNYSGYIDRVKMFGTAYDNRDYDGDGKKDRLYKNIVKRDQNGAALKINYRIDFGNGQALTIGDFDDVFTGIKLIGYDLTGDGVKEIIFCGEHTSSTFPKSSSEIAVFKKKNNSYELLALPRPDDWKASEKYRAGYSIYIKNIKDNKVTFYSSKFHHEETINTSNKAVLDYFKKLGKDPASESAWKVDVYNDKGIATLVLYMNLGSKYYHRNLTIALTWQNRKMRLKKVLQFASPN